MLPSIASTVKPRRSMFAPVWVVRYVHMSIVDISPSLLNRSRVSLACFSPRHSWGNAARGKIPQNAGKWVGFLPADGRGARSFANRARRGLREQRHAFLEAGGPIVVGRELAAYVATVDRLAEDGRLPECERLEPAERLDVAPAAARISLDQLGPGRKAFRCGHRRR